MPFTVGRSIKVLLDNKLISNRSGIFLSVLRLNICKESNSWMSTCVGDKGSLTKTFTAEDVRMFADISLDSNPIHLNNYYAKTTRFGKTIVHGVLNMGLLSAVMGTVVPGRGSILIGYDIKYTAPLYVGESVTAEVVATQIKGHRGTFQMTCFTNDGKVVAKGTSLVLLPKETQ